MKVDGATATVVNYNSKPVQDVQVDSYVQKTKPIEKTVQDNVRESVVSSDMVQQIISARKGELPISEKILVEAINRANKAIIGSRREFEYKVHKQTGAVSIKVIDSETKEIIREVPPEKILDLIANLMELAGVLVDERR